MTELRISGRLNQDDPVEVKVNVRNTGAVAGREVVQVYLSGPSSSNIDRAARTLEGFAKTRLLEAGEDQTITIRLGRRSFSVWSASEHAWLVESGVYGVQIGSSSDRIQASSEVSVDQSFTWSGLQ